ncbi:hypothetical protein [Chryseobacterium sp. SL1]|uniref:hypothetical protein n=1 Tax=Chryseobacterium sp. SL1 TaxID=2995159 RepID=UPI0022739237|nr:hypothetical protein [Chryseobacterium sp. SL1]MCY1660121.1 hypothetical protein [Chryseobacterium sp. SL1]
MKTTTFQLGLPPTQPQPTVLSGDEIFTLSFVTAIILPIVVYIPQKSAGGTDLPNAAFWIGAFKKFFTINFTNVKEISKPLHSSLSDDLFIGVVSAEAVFTNLDEINYKLRKLLILLRELQHQGNINSVQISIDNIVMEFNLQY